MDYITSSPLGSSNIVCEISDHHHIFYIGFPNFSLAKYVDLSIISYFRPKFADVFYYEKVLILPELIRWRCTFLLLRGGKFVTLDYDNMVSWGHNLDI